VRKMGGAWDCVAIVCEPESNPNNSLHTGRSANTAGETETPFTVDCRTNGACIAGIVLQQSWP
jgi:hypothetical protein